MTKLGQNFLKSREIVEKIIKAAEIKKNDIVLEIGPGRGILTEALLEKAGKVIAVEKDTKLVEYLKEKFKNKINLELISGDILKFNPSGYTLVASGYKVVANIPYYITSRFLRQFLSAENQPELMVLMVQKEVAERIVAKPPKMSVLAVSVQVYGESKIICNVSKKYFSPAPKVDSAVIKIDNISRKFFNYGSSTSIVGEKEFFNLVRKGFSHKRKMLKNNLKTPKTECLADIADALKKCGIPENARAQELSPENWRCICQTISYPQRFSEYQPRKKYKML